MNTSISEIKRSHKIQKQFDFCYGHAVHCQCLDEKASLNAKPKCRHLHGHNGILIVELSSPKLDETGMVWDFNNLNFIKEIVDKVLDHKFILDKDDIFWGILKTSLELQIKEPVEYLFQPNPLAQGQCLTIFEPYFQTLQKKFNSDSKAKRSLEILEGIVLVDFVPTSENLCEWFYDIIQNFLRKTSFTGVLESVSFHETPKTRASLSFFS